MILEKSAPVIHIRRQIGCPAGTTGANFSTTAAGAAAIRHPTLAMRTPIKRRVTAVRL